MNKLLKMHQEMSRAMKQIKKMGGLKGLAAMFGGGGGGMGGAGSMPRAEAAECPACPEWAAAGTSRPTCEFTEKKIIAHYFELAKENIMAIALRLSRGGAKKRPYYRIVAADSRRAA